MDNDQDRRILRVLELMRAGRFVDAEKILNEVERMYTYAGSTPSKDGFSNLLHCMKHLINSHTLANGHEPLRLLTAREEADTYDPNIVGETPYDPK
jgi:hypothetical protein